MPTWGRFRKKYEQQTCLPPPNTIILKYYDNHFIIYLIHIIIHLFQFYTNIELEKNLEHTFSLHESCHPDVQQCELHKKFSIWNNIPSLNTKFVQKVAFP